MLSICDIGGELFNVIASIYDICSVPIFLIFRSHIAITISILKMMLALHKLPISKKNVFKPHFHSILY